MLTQDSITLFAVVRGGVKVGEQDNRPLLEEAVVPGSGTPWTWNVTGYSGFSGVARKIDFDYDDAQHTQARVKWSGFVDADWVNGVTGSFRVVLSNGVDPDLPEQTCTLSLRSLPSVDFTVVQGQSRTDVDSICAAPGSGGQYTWSASGATGFTPAPTIGFAFDGGDTDRKDGRLTVGFGGDWSDANGTFSLSIQDGTREASVFDGSRTGASCRPKLSLRKLVGDGYTVIHNQASGGTGVSAAGAGGFAFATSGFAGFSPAPTLSLGAMGEVTSCSCASWNQSGTFTLAVQDDYRPASIFDARALTLRQLVGDGYTAIQGQTSGGDGVNAAGANGFTFSASGYAGFSPAPALSLGAMGEVTSCSCASWNQSGTFTLTVKDGARPDSVFTGRALTLRRLNHTTFNWFVGQTIIAGETKVSADPATGTYNWTLVDASASLSMSNSGAKNENVAISATSGASGTETGFSLEIADGARPASVVPVTLKRRHVDPDPAVIPYAAGGGSAALQVKSGLVADAGPWDFGAMTFTPPTLDAALDGAASANSAGTAITWTALDPAGGTGTATFTLAPHDGSAPPCTVEIQVNAAAQIPVEPDGVDVAILVDRSGSMSSQNRWKAAMSGAKLFAELVREATGQTVTADPYPGSGTHTWTTAPHRAGLAWFWGRRNPGNTPNFPNPTPPEPGYPEGFHNWFTDAAGDSYRLPDGASLAKLDNISAESPTGTLAEQGPGNLTALGSGMLFCRNALVAAADPVTSNRGRVLLVLSDGMENRAPLLAALFDGSKTGLWFREEGDVTLALQDPKIKLHAAAVLTGASWVDRLRAAVTEAGGDATLDVKHITDYATSDVTLQHWFVNRFRTLFGFDEADAGPDPELAAGQTATRAIPVTLGHTKLVFYALFGQPDAAAWELKVIPPGQEDAICYSLAAGYPGVRASGGGMHRMIALDLPLAIPGHEHRWAGEWRFEISRAGAGSGAYAMGVLARRDGGTGLAIEAPAVPRPGDRVRLRAVVKDQDGKPVTDAAVMTRVREPGPWPGGEVALEAGHNLALVKKLRQSRKASDVDMTDVADRVLRHLYERAALGRGTTRKVPLAHTGGGVYEAAIRLEHPGTHDLDTTITGRRASSPAEFQAKLGQAFAALPGHYPAAALKAERTWLARAAGAKQKFTVELRDQLAVAFLPTIADSETGGYFADAATIRLLVQPAGAKGVLLGPGWADSIRFLAPGGVTQAWPATDLGDGNYQVDIEVRREGDVRFDLRLLALAAERFALVHPTTGPVELRDGLLELAEFEAEVLGVRMPIAVLSLVGNSRSKECHLVSCAFAAKIAPKNKVWLHDLEHARKCGYDTCEHCLPLICNTDPQQMEAHKPFCRWARKIKPANRLEVHGWKQAAELGFDGCWYCLREHHRG
jgi:hypothetical protein